MAPSPAGRLRSLAVAAGFSIGALFLAACGGSGDGPIQKQADEDHGKAVGFPVTATKNTTRIPGKDAVEDAAAVAAAVYPGLGSGQRPQVVTLVDKGDWRAGVAASVLMAAPVKSPILLTNAGDVPGATSDALDFLKPGGSPYASGAQALSIGSAARPKGLRSLRVFAKDPFTLAEEIDGVYARASGRVSDSVVVTSAAESSFSMPAAGWAAKSGNPVLFAGKDTLPAPTRRAISRHKHPGIYVLGPPSVISAKVLKELGRLGTVSRIGGSTPIQSAIAFARFSDGNFGWGVQDPGHGLVVANLNRPLDAAAAAPLSASGTYGPLLLTDSPKTVPAPLANYLLDIQPGYRSDPVRGVYNHAWLMGDLSAISAATQAKIDQLTEIVRVRRKTAP